MRAPSNASSRPAELGERMRWRFERLPLRWRLALATFGLLAVLLAALGILVSLTEEQALLRNQATALYTMLYDQAGIKSPTSLGRGFSGRGQTPPPVATTPPSNLTLEGQILTNHLTGPSTIASLLSPSGDVIAGGTYATTLPSGLASPPMPAANEIQRALHDRVSVDWYYTGSATDGQRWLYILLPVIQRGSDGSPHTVAVLQLSERTSAIDRAVAAMRLILFYGLAGTLLLAGALALPLVGAALRPLRDMERASRRISAGALSLRLKEPETDDEIGHLAHSFNAMVARLEEAFARQKRFVSDVSHELRTPLTALGGQLEMLMLGADAGNPETQRRLVRGMYAETERMRRLVEDLLTLARLDEGRLPLRPAPVDVATIVRDVCEQAGMLAMGQEVACDTPAAPLMARADGDRLREVLLNLVENALKFTPAGGTVSLAACVRARWSWRCSTRARASRPRRCRTFSTASTAPTSPGHARRRARAAAGWASPSPRA
jgi:two-component system, OmpR family, sensor kinase